MTIYIAPVGKPKLRYRIAAILGTVRRMGRDPLRHYKPLGFISED